MWYFLIPVFLLLATVLTITACKTGSSATDGKDTIRTDTGGNLPHPGDSIKGVCSRKDLEKKLRKLAETPVPDDLKIGAMCYSSVAPPDRVEYTCPVCGEKTTWTRKYVAEINALPYIRSDVESLSAIKCTLDESQFCKKCKPQVKDPSICISIQIYGENGSTTSCDITKTDLQVLREFLNGSLVHKTFNASETPLKDYENRIRQLLGMEKK
jgi:hypothetical protein